MKRKLSLLTAAALLLVGLVFVPLSPASASADLCVGQGTATTDNPVYYPITPPPGPLLGDVDGGVHFSLAIGGCLVSPAEHNGTVHGDFEFNPGGVDADYCGHSTGRVLAAGHGLVWVSVASMLILVDDPEEAGIDGLGVVNAIPNALGPDGSCATGAKNFLVTGVLVLLP